LAVVRQSDTNPASSDVPSSYHYYPNATAINEESIQTVLDTAIREGLMEHVSADTVEGVAVKFSHDRIRQGCCTLVPSDENVARMLHLDIGTALRRLYSGEVEEGLQSQKQSTWMLFSAVDHLNIAFEMKKCSNEDAGREGELSQEKLREEYINLAALNLEAGEKAISLAAFSPATDYLSKGVELLRFSNCTWTTTTETTSANQNNDHYNLILKLHTELASTLYVVGQMNECQNVSNIVLDNANTLEEKFRCYLNIMACLKAGGKLEDSVEVGIDFLSQLGEPFSLKPSKMKLASEARATRKLLAKYEDDQLLNLPDCTNECKGMAVYVLGMLFGPMVHLNHKGALDYLRLRSVRLTVKYGVCDASALAYAYYGSHLVSSKNIDLEGGHRYGKIALRLLDRLDSTELKSRTILLSNFLIVHWKEPLPKTLDRLMDGYDVGMLNGDIEMAFTCAGIYLQHFYYCGLPLQSAVKDIREYCGQMKEYQQNKELRQAQPLWQTMLNLMGEASHPTILTGDAMDQDEFESGNIGVIVMTSYRMQLAYYFGDYELAETCMKTLRPQSGGFTAPYFQVARRFFFALISLGLARKESSAKQCKAYLKQAKADIEWIKERVSKGGINCLHKLMILEAELHSFTKQKDIRQLYDKAIMTANRNGFKQDNALANELAGVFCLESYDLYWATFYLERACWTYNQWGAFGKVNQLKVKYPDILDKDKGEGGNSSRGKLNLGRTSGASTGSNHLGRRRFSSKLSATHKSLSDSIRRLSISSVGSDV